MRITVYSASLLKEGDKEKIRFIMETSDSRDRDLANAFPQRFRQRKGSRIFFDKGKRRYVEMM